MKSRSMSYWQKRTFILCWGAYTFAYLGRINLSVAIPLIEKNIGLNKTSLGFVGGVFFWIYAFGQLINGRLGDKFAVRSFVFTGLFVSAAANILFGFSESLLIMIVLWAFNGYFQSMLWGPLIKTLHRWFPERRKPKVALYIFSSVVAGFLLTWGGLGQILPYIGWEGAFWIPGSIMLIYSLLWHLYIRNSPEELGLCPEDEKLAPAEIESNAGIKDNEVQYNSFWKLIFHTRVYLIAISCIPLGFVREGISLWGPTMLFEMFQLKMQFTMGGALLIPLFNFFGVIAARLFIEKYLHNETKLVALFFAGGVLTSAMLYFLKDTSIIVYLALLAACSLSLYGATSILTSVIPLKYHMTSSVAGFLDFSIYLGAGLSVAATGFLSQKLSWNIVVLLWVIAGITGSVFICIAGRRGWGQFSTNSQNQPIF